MWPSNAHSARPSEEFLSDELFKSRMSQCSPINMAIVVRPGKGKTDHK